MSKEKRIEKRLNRIKSEKRIFDKEMEIRKLKKSMSRWTTTKIVMALILINCTVIEIYSMISMWHFADLSALYTLITAVVTESLSFAIYCCKAYNETKQEELIKLERDKLGQGDNIEDSPEGEEL